MTRRLGLAALLLLLLLLLVLLFFFPTRLRAGTVERLGDFATNRAGFPTEEAGWLVAAIVGVEPDGGRALACITAADLPQLWAFGATPESAEPLGGPCPSQDPDQALPLTLAAGTAAESLLYVAAEGEVWRSDGTRAGTYLLVPRSTTEWQVTSLVARGDRALLFVEQQLWVTDGTLAGTRRLVDLEGDFLGAEALGGATLFITSVGEYEVQVWRTDGTAAGTQRLARIPTYYPYGSPLVKVGRRVFLLLTDSLWTSDGTEAGTRVAIESLYDLGIDGGVSAVAYRGGLAFEAAPTDGFTPELWFTDGTVRGTRRLAAPEPSSDYSQLRVLGRHLLYAAGGMLWVSDGTPRGTALLAGCRGGCAEDYGLTDVELDGALLLLGWDERYGGELWRTDGTGPGTRIVRESCPGPCGHTATEPVAWRGGVAYLVSSAEGVSLWFSDGTAAGTRKLVDLGDVTDTGWLLPVGDRLYVMLSLPDLGWQLWTLDGTAAGSRPLTRQLDYGRPDEEELRSWARSDGGIFITTGYASLASDGSRAGTFELEHYLLGIAGGLGIAVRGSGHGTNELVALAGDGSPPELLAELPARHWVRWAAPFGERLALSFACGSCGTGNRIEELWTTDGTAAGTGRRFVFPNAEPTFAGSDGGDFFFVTRGVGVGGGSLLWKSDGTEAGTVELAHRPGIVTPLVRAGGELFFVAAGRSFGPELWRTDGTPQGTRPVFDDGGPRGPRELAAFDGALFIAAAAEEDEEEGERALWRFDIDTRELTEVGRFATLGGAGWAFAASPERLFFTAADMPFAGDALWVTDGTAAGTARLAGLTPAAGPFDTRVTLPAPAVLGDELLFTALDRDHGTEPWVSDGTLAGTRLLRDLVPGPQGSLAAGWVAAGGRVFFAAGDAVRAPGLYLYDSAAAACATGAERVCLAGRLEAELAFPGPSDDDGVATALTAPTGFASAAFTHPLSGEPLVVMRASPAPGGGELVAAAGLTRDWWIGTVTDTATGEARRYVSLPGVAVRFDDRAAFAAAGAGAAKGMRVARVPAARALQALAPRRAAGGPASPAPLPLSSPAALVETFCTPDPTTACLLDGTFSVRGRTGGVIGAARALGPQVALVDWPGSGGVPPGGDPEAAVRIASAVGGGFELFFAALSPAEGVATVRDATGRRGVYVNAAGSLALVDDVTTFAPRGP